MKETGVTGEAVKEHHDYSKCGTYDVFGMSRCRACPEKRPLIVEYCCPECAAASGKVWPDDYSEPQEKP